MIEPFDAGRPMNFVLPAQWKQRGVSAHLASAQEVESSSGASWAIFLMNWLITDVFNPLFPGLDVQCGILKCEVNGAFVHARGMTEGTLVVTTKLLEDVHASARKIEAAREFAPGLPQELQSLPEQPNLSIGCMALTALLGHELGHVHDQQFVPPNGCVASCSMLQMQAKEMAADTWAIRACIDLILLGIKCSRIPEEHTVQYIQCGVTRALIGHGLHDRLDWVAPWSVPTDDSNATHPTGSQRLFSCAVAASEWVAARARISEDTAARICVDGFGDAARALHWSKTGMTMTAEKCIEAALGSLSKGDPISQWRVAYETFQAGRA